MLNAEPLQELEESARLGAYLLVLKKSKNMFPIIHSPPHLSSSVPDLHGDQPVVHHDFLGQEVSSDGGLVLVTELLVDVLVHQGRLAYAAVAQDDHLEDN